MKEIKIPKIENRETGSNNPQFNNNSEKKKKKKLIGQMKLKMKIQKRSMWYTMDHNQEFTPTCQRQGEQ